MAGGARAAAAPEVPVAAAARSGAAGTAPMSGFDTNPFADPVDINPFQVGTGPGRPFPPRPYLRYRRRDVALSEASLANGGTAPPRSGQSGRGGGIRGGVLGPGPLSPPGWGSPGVPAPPPRGRCDPAGVLPAPHLPPFPLGRGPTWPRAPSPIAPRPARLWGAGLGARRQPLSQWMPKRCLSCRNIKNNLA